MNLEHARLASNLWGQLRDRNIDTIMRTVNEHAACVVAIEPHCMDEDQDVLRVILRDDIQVSTSIGIVERWYLKFMSEIDNAGSS